MPADLSPIATHRVPEELEPLVEAFNDMLDRMKRNVEAQQRFVADAAHQMRTPLTGLKTQAQLAIREADPVALRHALRQIATGVDRAARLVNQLLTLARTEGREGAAQLSHTPLDLDELMREVVEEWVMRARKGASISAMRPDAAMNSLATLSCCGAGQESDRQRHALYPGRRDVTLSLVAGSRDCPGGRRRRYRYYRGAGRLVFERFYRVDGTGVDGSGLGLAIVREIADPAGRGAIARVAFAAWHLPPPPPPVPDDFSELYRQTPPIGT
jgi:two-component system sensor histidine kinase TctE